MAGLKLHDLNWRGQHFSRFSDWRVPFIDFISDSKDGNAILSDRLNSFGMVVVTGFPVQNTEISKTITLLKKYTLEFGCPVSQSAKLDFLGHVTNRGRDISDHKSRGYESAVELPFHSDRCDLLSLLCVRRAPVGGETRIVSAYAAYLQLAQTNPSLAAVLCEPVPFDLRDTTGGPSWALMPVFTLSDGDFVARYVRRFIEASQRFEDAPRLTDTQVAAFDALDAILYAPGMSLDLRLEPGEWLLIDNHRLLHARTEFQDAPDPAEARLLLRSWLCWSGSPELPPSFAPTYGRTKAGSYRGGVWPTDRLLSSMSPDLSGARTDLLELLS